MQETHLLLCALVGFDRVVNVLHGPFDEDHCVGPLCLRVHALVSHDGGDVSEHLLQLCVPLLV